MYKLSIKRADANNIKKFNNQIFKSFQKVNIIKLFKVNMHRKGYFWQ